MKRIYWDSFNYNNQRGYLTVDDFGLTFISDPGKGVSQIFDFYSDVKFEFCYQEVRTSKYVHQIEAYLAGELKTFNLPVEFPHDPNPLFKKVWIAVTKIPYGEVISLTQLMNEVEIGNAQAVLNALQQCPIEIVVPLHRVVDENLNDHVRGGKELQDQLLELEGTNNFVE